MIFQVSSIVVFLGECSTRVESSTNETPTFRLLHFLQKNFKEYDTQSISISNLIVRHRRSWPYITTIAGIATRIESISLEDTRNIIGK